MYHSRMTPGASPHRRRAIQVLRVSKMLERRVWATQSPLRQLDAGVSADVYEKLEAKRATPERLADMSTREIGQLVSNQRQVHPYGYA